MAESNTCGKLHVTQNAPVAASWFVWIRVVVDGNDHLQRLFLFHLLLTTGHNTAATVSQ